MDVSELADACRAAERLVVLTGAGMGLASGIPTFRGTDPGAVWANDVMELGTRAYFERNPVGSWRWYRSRFAGLRGAEPNAGHHALVALERWQRARKAHFHLVTQNIDTLHRRAGSADVVEVHGRADRVRCPGRRCEFAAPAGSLDAAAFDWAAFDAAPSEDTLPRCPACGRFVRAHVLWFDESYGEHRDYGYETAVRAFAGADLILYVGTSFAVGITAAALDARAAQWTIDPADAAPPGVRRLPATQEAALPALVAALA